MSETAQGSLTLGKVFSRGFAVMSGAAVTVFGISFLFGAIPQAIWSVIVPTMMVGIQPGQIAPAMTVMGLGFVVVIAFSMIAQGALVRPAIDHAAGRSTSIGQAVATGLVMILPLFGLAVLMMLGMGIGMLLLVVPGIILFLMWSVAVPALIDERPGIIGALRRSRELTKGSRWKIFGFFLVLAISLWIVMIVVGVATVTMGSADMMGTNPMATPTAFAIIIGLIFNTLFVGAWSTMTNALYLELRDAKEGLAPGNLAEVFA